MKKSKTGLIAKPVQTACQRQPLAVSRVSWPIIRLISLLAPFYSRYILRFQQIEIRHAGQMIRELQDFQAGQTRLIVAFRHPYGDEPQLIFHVVDNLLPRWARRNKIHLLHRPHLRLIHDYAVPLWGDAVIRFILPRVGAVPVYHVKFDPESLKRIRTILADDECPLGLAPEGQVSYHSETLPRIEQGTVRMGFWCAADLERANRPERVRILPVSVHYRYDRRDLKKVCAAVAELERFCGLGDGSPGRSKGIAGENLHKIKRRLEQIEDCLFERLHAYYAGMGKKSPAGSQPGAGRWDDLLREAIEAAEHVLGLSGRGDLVERMYRIRQEGWDRIYPTSIDANRTGLEKALASRRAGEAWYAMRHMEFVDLMSYHDAAYLAVDENGEPSYDRLVETVVNFQDLAARISGGTFANRPNILRKKAIIIPAKGLDLTARLPEYHRNAKKAAADATAELGDQFKSCIEEYLNGKNE